MTAVATVEQLATRLGAATAIAPNGSAKAGNLNDGLRRSRGNWLRVRADFIRNGDFSNAASGFCWIPPSPLCRPPELH